MRIMIELDGGSGDGSVAPGANAAGTTDAADADGGAGPGDLTPATAGGDVVVVTDGGPPPDWLLDAVAAAESAGPRAALIPAGPDDGLAADAGAGPGPDARSPDH
jgi:hypothetical protein